MELENPKTKTSSVSGREDALPALRRTPKFS